MRVFITIGVMFAPGRFVAGLRARRTLLAQRTWKGGTEMITARDAISNTESLHWQIILFSSSPVKIANLCSCQ